MALIPCRECKHEISKSAKTCPHCGIDHPGRVVYWKTSLVIWMIFGVFIWWVNSLPKPEKTPEQLAKESACQNDLVCLGDAHVFQAGNHCKKPIESLALYQFRWTDGWIDPKFSTYTWLDKEQKWITFHGHKLELQNGFGAWQQFSYECDYDTQHDLALNVRLLPNQ